MIEGKKFNAVVTDLLKEIEKTQGDKIAQAGEVIGKSLDNGGLLHVFSTGHSHMIAEEMFYRTGGLFQVDPILEPSLMLHQGAMKSTKIERLPGYAKIIADSSDLREDESIIIASNSGINSVIVEMAMVAKEKKLNVIAITSAGTSSKLNPRHSSGKRLMDVADIVIDNCLNDGDAVMEVPGIEQKTGAVSSITGIYIAQRIVISVVNEFVKRGKTPPIFMSANVPGGDEHNAQLVAKYGSRIRGLY